MAKKTDKTGATRQWTYRKKMAAAGFYPVQVFCTKPGAAVIQQIAADMRAGHKVLTNY